MAAYTCPRVKYSAASVAASPSCCLPGPYIIQHRVMHRPLMWAHCMSPEVRRWLLWDRLQHSSSDESDVGSLSVSMVPALLRILP